MGFRKHELPCCYCRVALLCMTRSGTMMRSNGTYRALWVFEGHVTFSVSGRCPMVGNSKEGYPQIAHDRCPWQRENPTAGELWKAEKEAEDT